MDNQQIAATFRRISDLMELKDENPFKIRSYRLAADTIEDYHEPLAALAAAGLKELQKIPGIGKAIGTNIIELVNTGTCSTYEQIKEEVPESTLELLRVSGIGPKTAQRLFRDYQITSLDQLEAFAVTGKLNGIVGLGKKTVDKIIHSIEQIKQTRGLLLLHEAHDFFETLQPQLLAIRGVASATLVGAARRGQELVERVEILLTVDDCEKVAAALCKLRTVKSVEANTARGIDLIFHPQIRVHFELVGASEEAVALVCTSSAPIHFESLQRAAVGRSLRLEPRSLYQVTGHLLKLADEAALYEQLGFPFITPELRDLPIEEIDLASQTRLVDAKDLRGDLHMHTVASDGANTIREMAEASRRVGLSYIAITDHSKSSSIANGLDERRLIEQMREIDAINGEFENFRILKGSEVDIRSDGSLDLPEEILSQLDFVVASVHSGFGQPRERITERVLRAFETGFVNVFAHPTGRLLGRRPGYEIDLARIIAAARQYQICLELNSNPHRLDLSADNLRAAREAGVRFILSTDAHSTHGLLDRRYGIATARRAGLTPGDLLNTLPLDQFRRAVSRR